MGFCPFQVNERGQSKIHKFYVQMAALDQQLTRRIIVNERVYAISEHRASIDMRVGVDALGKSWRHFLSGPVLPKEAFEEV